MFQTKPWVASVLLFLLHQAAAAAPPPQRRRRAGNLAPPLSSSSPAALDLWAPLPTATPTSPPPPPPLQLQQQELEEEVWAPTPPPTLAPEDIVVNADVSIGSSVALADVASRGIVRRAYGGGIVDIADVPPSEAATALFLQSAAAGWHFQAPTLTSDRPDVVTASIGSGSPIDTAGRFAAGTFAGRYGVVNVALGRGEWAEAPSALCGMHPERAVDGDVRGNASVAHSSLMATKLTGAAATDAEPYWQVDLGAHTAASLIKEVRVWNRIDGGVDTTRQIIPFWVLISWAPLPRNLSDAIPLAHASHRFTHPRRLFKWLVAEPTLRGRWVRIQLERTARLALAEVEVFAVLPSFQCPMPAARLREGRRRRGGAKRRGSPQSRFRAARWRLGEQGEGEGEGEGNEAIGAVARAALNRRGIDGDFAARDIRTSSPFSFSSGANAAAVRDAKKSRIGSGLALADEMNSDALTANAVLEHALREARLSRSALIDPICYHVQPRQPVPLDIRYSCQTQGDAIITLTIPLFRPATAVERALLATRQWQRQLQQQKREALRRAKGNATAARLALQRVGGTADVVGVSLRFPPYDPLVIKWRKHCTASPHPHLAAQMLRRPLRRRDWIAGGKSAKAPHPYSAAVHGRPTARFDVSAGHLFVVSTSELSTRFTLALDCNERSDHIPRCAESAAAPHVLSKPLGVLLPRITRLSAQEVRELVGKDTVKAPRTVWQLRKEKRLAAKLSGRKTPSTFSLSDEQHANQQRASPIAPTMPAPLGSTPTVYELEYRCVRAGIATVRLAFPLVPQLQPYGALQLALVKKCGGATPGLSIAMELPPMPTPSSASGRAWAARLWGGENGNTKKKKDRNGKKKVIDAFGILEEEEEEDARNENEKNKEEEEEESATSEIWREPYVAPMAGESDAESAEHSLVSIDLIGDVGRPDRTPVGEAYQGVVAGRFQSNRHTRLVDRYGHGRNTRRKVRSRRQHSGGDGGVLQPQKNGVIELRGQGQEPGKKKKTKKKKKMQPSVLMLAVDGTGSTEQHARTIMIPRWSMRMEPIVLRVRIPIVALRRRHATLLALTNRSGARGLGSVTATCNPPVCANRLGGSDGRSGPHVAGPLVELIRGGGAGAALLQQLHTQQEQLWSNLEVRHYCTRYAPRVLVTLRIAVGVHAPTSVQYVHVCRSHFSQAWRWLFDPATGEAEATTISAFSAKAVQRSLRRRSMSGLAALRFLALLAMLLLLFVGVIYLAGVLGKWRKRLSQHAGGKLRERVVAREVSRATKHNEAESDAFFAL